MWPKSHKIKVKDAEGLLKTRYNYTKTNNLFNINSIYIKVSNKPFIKGKKKLLEILLMYVWLSDFDVDEEYFEKYLNRVLEKKHNRN